MMSLEIRACKISVDNILNSRESLSEIDGAVIKNDFNQQNKLGFVSKHLDGNSLKFQLRKDSKLLIFYFL